MNRNSCGPVEVTPLQLTVRCLAEPKAGQWQAFSLEFGLAAQADTLDAVRAKLDGMIACYLEDALGQDRRHARALLGRKSTLSVRFKYYFFAWRARLGRGVDQSEGNVFNETLPLTTVPFLAA